MKGKIIREKRESLGLSMRELAAIIDVSAPTIARWENGEIKNMRRDRIEALANALDMSPLDLLGIERDERDDAEELNRLSAQMNKDQLRRLLHYARYLLNGGD